MIPYLLHASLLLSGCFIFYWLLIRKETFFRLNRWVLIFSILLSVTVPLIPVPEDISFRPLHTSEVLPPVPVEIEETEVPALASSPTAGMISDAGPANNKKTSTEIAPISRLNAPEIKTTETTPLNGKTAVSERGDASTSITAEAWHSTLNWGSLLWYGYLMGVLVFAMAFLVQLFVVVARMISLESFRDGRYKIIELVKDEAPYSFWNSIFINPAKYDPATYQQIIEHEKIHIQQAHFIDKLIAEFLVIVFWFNPFVWFFRRAITNNLEYLTDSSMLEIGAEKQRYQLSLLKVSVPQYPLHLTTNYNSSFLKSRIAMMNAKKSSARSSWKYLFLLPLLLFSMVCLNEVQSKDAELIPEMQQTESLQEQATPDEQSKPAEAAKDKVKVKVKPKVKNKNKVKNKVKSKVKHKNKVKHKSQSGNSMSYSMTSGDENMSFNFNNDNWSGDLRPGEWEGEIDGNQVCLQLNTSRPAMGYRSYHSTCFDKSEFSEIPMNTDKDFSIQREAGTLKLKGSFTGSFGDGTFKYEPDASFVSYLKGEGMSIREDKQLHLFMANIDKAYVSYLRGEGFKLDGDELIQLAVHGVDRKKAEDYVQLFKELDYKGYKVRDLITFEIHEVDPEYVNEIRAMGMTDLSVEEVVQAKIHDVEPVFIKAVKDYGFKDIGLQEIIQFSIHDVDVEYIEALKNLGFRDLSVEEIVQSSIHDVDPEYIAEMNAAGFKDMDMRELIQFSIHDINAEYVQSFKSAGLDVDAQEIIQAGIHDVDVGFVKALQASGLTDLRMGEIVQLAIHDVDVNYLQEMKAIGYNDMRHDEIIQAKIHDVDPAYIKELKAAGLDDLDIGEVVQFAIHDIEVDDIKAFKAAGFDVDNQEIIQAGIHDVSAKYVKEMRAMGFEDEDLEDFIRAKIHGVNPSFIKRAREKGYNPKSLQEYIQLKIGGM